MLRSQPAKDFPFISSRRTSSSQEFACHPNLPAALVKR
jgi:hypothetical protein